MIKDLLWALAIAVLFVAAVAGCTTFVAERAVENRCQSVQQDMYLLNLCERSQNCKYTLQDAKDITYRIAQCSYENPKVTEGKKVAPPSR